MAKYRIWFNTKRNGEADPNPWIVQMDDMGQQTAPAVVIQTEVSFVKGPRGSTPQGWAECEGEASRDGQTNSIVIRPL